MTAKRSPSLATILTRAAKAGAHLRVVLPDGTIIETLTGSDDTTLVASQAAKEAAEADRAFDGAFGKSVRKPQ